MNARLAFPLLAALLFGAAGAQTLPVNLKKTSNARVLGPGKDFPLGAAQQTFLAKNGFVIVPAAHKQFHHAYESTRYLYQPVFVTTDAVLHVYHLTFSKLLRDLERERLAPGVSKLTKDLLAAAEKQLAETRGTALESAARRAVAYLAVAARLSDPNAKVPAAVRGVVAQELALIAAHRGKAASPLLLGSDPDSPYSEDYGQYVPRGHYTRSEGLGRYFRAMMWLGRVNLRLRSDEETRVALLLTRLVRATKGAPEAWARVYDPTALLVGDSDDLDFRQYGAVAAKVYGEALPLKALADGAKLRAFREAARRLPPPQVNSLWVAVREQAGPDTTGLRFMGQRFTLDAHLMGELLWRKVGTEDRPRALPRALDVFAAFGSDEALNVLASAGETKYANYGAQMKAARATVAGLKNDAWTQNVYWSWLDVLRAVAVPEKRGARYPAFMRTNLWARKELQSALGSYTELKHDTVLYAKQVMAEMGSGEEPPTPRGYVEPNRLAWTRLQDLVRLTKRELGARRLLSANTAESLDSLGSMLALLVKATDAQLGQGRLTEDDYDRLEYFGGWLEELTLKAADEGGGEGAPTLNEDEQAAVVTDIATSPTGAVLTEATGRVFELYAVVPNGKGGLQVARGGVYSHYEFVVEGGERLTNEAWRARLAAGKAPAQPDWVRSIVVK